MKRKFHLGKQMANACYSCPPLHCLWKQKQELSVSFHDFPISVSVQFLFLWVCTNLESSEKERGEGTFQIWYTLTLDWLLNVILDRMTRRSAQARNFYAGQLSWTNWPLQMRAVYFRQEETSLENYKEWCERVVIARRGNEDVAVWW